MNGVEVIPVNEFLSDLWSGDIFLTSSQNNL